MASQVEAGVQDQLIGGAERGLWYCVYDPAGSAPLAGPGSRMIRGRDGSDRLFLYLIGSSDPTHPSVARSGPLEAVVAGRLFNADQLRGTRKSRATEESAAKLLLEAYRRDGLDALRAARGVFAVVIYDRERELLAAARDHLGMHPLFLCEVGGALVLSSSVQGMLAHPGVPGTLSRPHIVDQLRHAYPEATETYYTAVHRVMPGHMVIRRGGSTSTERYFDPLTPGRPIEWLTESEVGRFGEMLDQSVTRCLEISPAGIFLSGGLDSVSVAAVAADASQRLGIPPPLALSLRFPHPDVDEAQTQRRVAAQLGLPLVLLDLEEAVGPEGIFPAGLELCRNWHAPQLNPWLPAYCRLALEGRERGRGVVLSGGGGDEWLSVGPLYAADMVRAGDLRGIRFVWDAWKSSYRLSNFELARSLAKYGVWPPVKSVLRRGLTAVAPRALPAWSRWRQSRTWPEWLAPDRELRAATLERDLSGPEDLTFDHERLAFYLADGRQALDHVSVSLEMEEDFEVGRRLGILELDPYWDPDLVDFLYRTPPELLLRGGRGKGLVRWMLSERFPDLGFESQRKMVSLDYFQSMVLGDTARAWSLLGGVPALSDLGIVDGRLFEQALRSIVAGRRRGEAYRIWDVLVMEAWVQGRG